MISEINSNPLKTLPRTYQNTNQKTEQAVSRVLSESSQNNFLKSISAIPDPSPQKSWSKISSKFSQTIASIVNSLSGLFSVPVEKKLGSDTQKTKQSTNKASSQKLLKKNKAKNSSPSQRQSPQKTSKTKQEATKLEQTHVDPIINTKEEKSKALVVGDSPPDQNLYSWLNVATDLKDKPSIYTEDGYIITAEGKEQAWIITGPDGKQNRIWGDPHVHESDGDTWDFKDQSSFIFGNNKVTIETVALENGQTLTSKITVYNGDSRASISGINNDKPIIDALRQDAPENDLIKKDGDIFLLSKEGNGGDRFILIKDVDSKFDSKYEKILSLSKETQYQSLLTQEQIKLFANG